MTEGGSEEPEWERDGERVMDKKEGRLIYEGRKEEESRTADMPSKCTEMETHHKSVEASSALCLFRIKACIHALRHTTNSVSSP